MSVQFLCIELYIMRCIVGRLPADVVFGRYATEVLARDQAPRQWALGLYISNYNRDIAKTRRLKIFGNAHRIEIL